MSILSIPLNPTPQGGSGNLGCLGHHEGRKGHGLFHGLLGKGFDALGFSELSHEVLLHWLVVFIELDTLQDLHRLHGDSRYVDIRGHT